MRVRDEAMENHEWAKLERPTRKVLFPFYMIYTDRAKGWVSYF